jgi:hypothetical protein
MSPFLLETFLRSVREMHPDGIAVYSHRKGLRRPELIGSPTDKPMRGRPNSYDGVRPTFEPLKLITVKDIMQEPYGIRNKMTKDSDE